MTIYRNYEENYKTIANHDMIESIEPIDYLKYKSDKIYSLIKKHLNKNTAVCEIGPGKGFLIEKMLENHINPCNITVVDIASEYLDAIQNPKINKIQANAEFLNIEEQFDIIIATDVAEHVLNLSNFMFSLNKALKKNGTLILGVPYRENLIPYAKELGCKYEFAHLRTFDISILKDLLIYSGFSSKRFKKMIFHIKAPRRFIRKFRIIRHLYLEIISVLEKLGATNSRVTKAFPSFLLKLFLSPSELLVIARKKKTISKANMFEF